MDNKQKNIRALKLLAAASVIFLLAVLVFDPLYNKQQDLDNEIRLLEKKAAKIKEINQQAASNIKSVEFEMPQNQELQLLLFRKELLNDLKSCGMKWAREPYYTSERGKKEKTTGLKIFYMKVNLQSTFFQSLDLLDKLAKNKYLYAIDEFNLTREGNDQQKVKLDLTVSTLAK